MVPHVAAAMSQHLACGLRIYQPLIFVQSVDGSTVVNVIHIPNHALEDGRQLRGGVLHHGPLMFLPQLGGQLF
jgi:hypothetical protein